MKTPLHCYAPIAPGVDPTQESQDLRKSIGLKHCPPLKTGEDVARAFAEMAHLKREIVVAGAVDIHLRLVGWNVVSPDPHNPRALRIGDAFLPVVKTGAAGVVLIRNSAYPYPRTSLQEFEFLRNISEAAQLLGYAVVDYIVVSKRAWCSLLEKPVVEAHAGVLNLSPIAPAKSGAAKWNCRHCQKANQHAPATGMPIYGRYLATHCAHCRTFAWVV